MRGFLYVNMAITAVAGAGAGVSVAYGFYLTALIFVCLIFICCTAPFTWKRAFRVGWLRGRVAMMDSLAEATRRNMSLPDWIGAELERDGIHYVRLDADDEP